jgi:hypothetical protein
MAFDFKKIKSLFVTETEDSEKQKKDAETNDSNKDSNKQKDVLEMLKNKDQEKTVVNDNTVVGPGKVDNKILDSLIKALDDNNLPGEDYMEYAAALKAMDNIPLEESIKIQTVLATLSTKGLTKDKIIESGTFYVSILEKEKDKFGKAIDKQTKDGITSKNDEIAALEALNKTKSNQIAQLTKEITDNQQQMEQIKTKIADTNLKIKATEGNFNTTFQFVVSQMQANIDKIKALVPNAPEKK